MTLPVQHPYLPTITVRYFREDGQVYATFANWSAAAGSMEELRKLAADCLTEHQGHPYESRFYAEQTAPTVPSGQPFAHEEFWPSGREPSHATFNMAYVGPRA